MTISSESDLSSGFADRDRTIVLGVGNILYGDEGVGVFAVHALEQSFNFDPKIELFDGATMGFNMIDLFKGTSKMITADAIATSAPPGTIFRLPVEELATMGKDFQPTAHEVDPIHLLQLSPLMGDPPDMVLFGIVPSITSELTLGLSSELKHAFPSYVEKIVEELEGLGIGANQVAPISFDRVLDGLTSDPQ